MNEYIVVRIDPRAPRYFKNRLSKVLHGTTVSIKGRRYRAKGLLHKLNALMLCPGTYLVPEDKINEFLNELGKRGLVKYVIVSGKCTCIQQTM